MWDTFIKGVLFKIVVRAKRVTDIICRIYEINTVNIKKGGELIGKFRRKKILDLVKSN